MRWALGCAFNIEDMLIRFPYTKLDCTCNQCKEILNDFHRSILVKRIFRENVKMVLSDIIHNNVTFWLPLTGNKKCNMHMRRVQGEAFKRLRQAGKWEDVEIFSSMFSGYEIGFYLLGNRTPREKTVYVDKKFKSIITQKTNEGFNYGDSKNDTNIKDYYQQMFDMFPQVSQHDIKAILSYCWKQVYLLNSYGGDLCIKDNNFWCYIGALKKDPLSHFYYYKRKLITKIRVLYRRKKMEWDGYYYFALSQSEYDKYVAQQNPRGRRKKYFKFDCLLLYLLEDECKLKQNNYKYIFRVRKPFITKLVEYHKNVTLTNPELILVREPLKFKDILVTNNSYIAL